MTGIQLREWRERRGWEVERAAAKFRVSERIWTRWESRSRPVPEFLVGMIDQLEEIKRLRSHLDRLQSGVFSLLPAD